MNRKRCLITGAAGFLGQNLIHRLMGYGHEIHIIARSYLTFSHALARRYPKHSIKQWNCNLAAYASVKQLINTIEPHWIFHLAAKTKREDTNKEMFDNNVVATEALLRAAHDANKPFESFIMAGASQEYGKQDWTTSENHALYPDSYYGVTKAMSSLLGQYFATVNGTKVLVLRIYSGYGPFDYSRKLIPTLIRLGKENKLPPLVNPNVAHDFIYIEDVVDAFMNAASLPWHNPTNIINIGSGQMIRLNEVVEIARRELNITVEPEWNTMEDCQYDTSFWCADNRIAKETLHWKPTYNFIDGFRKTIEWTEKYGSD